MEMYQYDKRGFMIMPNGGRGKHQNGTWYDNEGYNSKGYNLEGYDKAGYNKKGFNEEGIHRNGTQYDDDGYDIYGNDKEGYNRFGYDIYGYDKEGYNSKGYNREGYNRAGYNKKGFNKEGIHRNGTQYDLDGYDRDGYNQEGYNRYGYDRDGYDKEGYDSKGYNQEGYNKSGYNKKGFNKEGIHRNGTKYDFYGYDIKGCNQDGYDRYGYDRDGYDKRGFHKVRIHRNGTRYDDEGYNYLGYNVEGYDRDGFSERGFNREGLHRNGTKYDDKGYDQAGYNREGYNREGYNALGLDKSGYDRDGYNEEGLNKNGYNQLGFNSEGLTKIGSEYFGIALVKEFLHVQKSKKQFAIANGLTEQEFDTILQAVLTTCKGLVNEEEIKKVLQNNSSRYLHKLEDVKTKLISGELSMTEYLKKPFPFERLLRDATPSEIQILYKLMVGAIVSKQMTLPQYLKVFDIEGKSVAAKVEIVTEKIKRVQNYCKRDKTLTSKVRGMHEEMARIKMYKSSYKFGDDLVIQYVDTATKASVRKEVAEQDVELAREYVMHVQGDYCCYTNVHRALLGLMKGEITIEEIQQAKQKDEVMISEPESANGQVDNTKELETPAATVKEKSLDEKIEARVAQLKMEYAILEERLKELERLKKYAKGKMIEAVKAEERVLNGKRDNLKRELSMTH